VKVYVAGGMYDPGIEYVKMIQDALRVCGHEISYDWTAEPISETGNPDERRQLAEAERDGVLGADLLILLDHNRPRGALIELGMALGTGKEALVLIEEGRNPSLFYSLPNCTIIASHDNLLRAIELLPHEPGEYD
jgi:nucleoside 2-deoxyribosyltransferase